MADKFNILDYTAGPLLKTGQTTDRTPAGRTSKDDGGVQAGIVGSKADDQYVILTLGQFSGTTNITVNGKTDTHTNNCVFDKVTGLMWSREPSDNVFGDGTQDLLWDDTAGSDEDIFEYCDQANLAGLAGFSDWRVPNILELCSLVVYDSALSPPLINQTVFPTWIVGSLYSSTTVPTPTLTVNALTTDFSSGFAFLATKTSARRSTALVRLGS